MVNYDNNGEGEERLVYGHKLSSIGPATVTGEMIYEPSNIDLAMKLHYLRVVYLFDKEAVEGLNLSLIRLKEALFSWLNFYYETCGRFRRSDDTGRPYIKCNDCGMRFVEAKSSLTLEEWLNLPANSLRLLVPHHVIGPELNFSPPTFLQMTFLKCGGLSLGLSWTHVLGDAFSVATFMNSLGPFLKGLQPTSSPNFNKSPLNIYKPAKAVTFYPLSMKKVGLVGDNWAIEPPGEIDSFSFHLTTQQLAQLCESEGDSSLIQPFESISAVIWRAIAKMKVGSEPNVVTFIKPGPKADDTFLRNNQIVSSVKVDFSVAKAHLKDLVALICNQLEDETTQIAEQVGQDPGGSDFIIYGANLTFVDLGGAEFYGFELKGSGPELVNCFVDGLGEKGVVLVLPRPKSVKHKDEGRLVTLISPKSYLEELKKELKKQWPLIA